MNFDGVVAGLVLWAAVIALELAWLLAHGRRSR
jgi:hypothetical protein